MNQASGASNRQKFWPQAYQRGPGLFSTSPASRSRRETIFIGAPPSLGKNGLWMISLAGSGSQAPGSVLVWSMASLPSERLLP